MNERTRRDREHTSTVTVTTGGGVTVSSRRSPWLEREDRVAQLLHVHDSD